MNRTKYERPSPEELSRISTGIRARQGVPVKLYFAENPADILFIECIPKEGRLSKMGLFVSYPDPNPPKSEAMLEYMGLGDTPMCYMSEEAITVRAERMIINEIRQYEKWHSNAKYINRGRAR